MRVKAVIWDYDGTLVDTRRKNLIVSRAIISKVSRKSFEEFPALVSLENYEKANLRAKNWQALYREEFGFTQEETDYAGSLWTEYQLLDTTQTEVFEGIAETLKALENIPHGIVSQNSHQNIRKNLKQFGLDGFFDPIIGYEEVGYENQKPHPEGLLFCISRMVDLSENDLIIYIGDHETDAQCAFYANQKLATKQVVSVGAMYDKADLSGRWKFRPDHIATKTLDIVEIVSKV
ncbi:MAG: HAD family hydrolase [Pyrinomonadaceae bacterium]